MRPYLVGREFAFSKNDRCQAPARYPPGTCPVSGARNLLRHAGQARMPLITSRFGRRYGRSSLLFAYSDVPSKKDSPR